MYSKELIQRIHQTLPAELLEPIASDATLGAIEEIAVKKDLSVEQMRKLEKILSLRLMGLVTQEKFTENVQNELGINPDIASTIADELNKKVLGNIPSDLLKNQEEAAAKELLNRKEEVSSVTTHDNLPMIEPGEVAHEVPHVEAKPEVATPPEPVQPSPAPAVPPIIPAAPPAPEPVPSTPAPTGPVKTRPHSDTRPEKLDAPAKDYRYPGGADPYREPLQ